MGVIGTTGGYYQLSNLLSSGSGASNALTGSNTALQTLEQAFESSQSGSAGNSYLLDLSPEAQNYMNSSSSSGTSSQFKLTAAQETQVTDILDKYKNAPLTQATFIEIQNALHAAGLSPQTLGAEDQVKSFNPTTTLLQALDGNYSGLQTPAASASDEQTKETNYLQNIVSFWKSIDTGASSASGSSAGNAVASRSGAGL